MTLINFLIFSNIVMNCELSKIESGGFTWNLIIFPSKMSEVFATFDANVTLVETSEKTEAISIKIHW